jgi:hypothetical protein
MHWLNLMWNILVFLGAGSLTLFLLGLSTETGSNLLVDQVSDRALYLWAYTAGFVALMAFIALAGSIGRLTSKTKHPKPSQAGWLRFSILLFPLIIWAVAAWNTSIVLPDWLFSLLVYLGVLIPVVWLLRIASGHLWGQHKDRDASVISFSSSFSISIILLIQAVILVSAIVIIVVLNPAAFTRMPGSLNEIEELFLSPVVILAAIVFVAVIVPVVEELFKTLAVWPLLGLNISPGEGYVAGMMSGAGFALLEGMLFAAQTAMTPGGDWVYFLIGRLGGTLIHVFNGGLVGWALAESWRDRKFARLLVIYLVAFIIHGMWNLSVVITQLVPTLMAQEVNQGLTNMVVIILGGLIGVGFIYFGRHVLLRTKLLPVSTVKDANAS